MLQEGQKNSTANLISALHFQHLLSFSRSLVALLAHMLYRPVSSHAFLEREIELFTVLLGSKAAIVGINRLLNMLWCLLSPRK